MLFIIDFSIHYLVHSLAIRYLLFIIQFIPSMHNQYKVNLGYLFKCRTESNIKCLLEFFLKNSLFIAEIRIFPLKFKKITLFHLFEGFNKIRSRLQLYISHINLSE